MAKERFADLQIDLIVDGGSENNNTLVNVGTNQITLDKD
jgi:hypothetical protein